MNDRWIAPSLVICVLAFFMIEPAVGPVAGAAAIGAVMLIAPLQAWMGRRQSQEKRKSLLFTGTFFITTINFT